MKLTMLDQMRVWAALTGLALTLWFFAAVYFELQMSATVPMLVSGIGGFELFFYAQDVWLRRKGNHG